MSEFNDLQKTLGQTRSTRDDVSRQLRTAREREQKLERRIETLLRSRRDDDTATARQIESLKNQVAQQAGHVKRSRSELDRLAGVEDAALNDFVRFSDPIANLSKLSAGNPIVLFPVRIETRFKNIGTGPAAQSQLWVRVYPDDIAIDTFEDMLAEVEARNATAYWIHVWKAGGIEAEKRAAWRTLANSHGAGRANWILGEFRPLNLADEPVKADGQHILVVVSDQPLSASERVAAATYWRAVWLANGNATAIAAAFLSLAVATGQDRAQVIRDRYAPVNLSERPVAPTDVKVAFLDLPSTDQLDTQQQPWARPAHTRILPERLVLIGYTGTTRTLEIVGRQIPADLTVGPDPSADPSAQLRVENGDLAVPDAMRWLIDFDHALLNGMAFKVDLPAAQARQGFDQLFVLGVRIASDAASSKAQLEELFRHHQASRKGLSIALQGMPTNNTEAEPSAYTWQEDADVSFNHYFGEAAPEDPVGWQSKRDGRWLAEFLGLDPAVVKGSANYYAQDQRDARAMNLALWPATLGYFMDRMMTPVFDDATVEATRSFFTRFVSGRGALPALRLGAQPYGILPATAFSRMRWIAALATDRRTAAIVGPPGFLGRLYELLKQADQDWAALVPLVSYVGKGGDPHQILLDVVGLHPTSVEFFNRMAESGDQIFNQFRYHGLGGEFLAALIAGAYTQSGIDLLMKLGFTASRPEDVPEILSKFFLSSADRLDGPLIDDQPLSEIERIRAFRENGDNYITWLIAAARTSHDALRRQEGFLDDKPPTALLYLMLHHALDLSYLDVGLDLHVKASLMTAAQAKTARMDPRFIHVQAAETDPGTPWQYLYKREPAITQDPGRLVGDFVPDVLATERPYLQTQLEALEYLASVPTGRLERAFAEHLDCCAYRLDAWWLALVAVQLTLMRTSPDAGEGERALGSYIGAFGWLEDVRPENKRLERVELDGPLATVFQRPGEAPLERDPTNAGHLLAPSLNHAVTAAVLRNGYLSNATPANPDTLAINLSSQRVRLALEMIEGIRAGQSLGALLGYQLERGLHDQGTLFLDDIILDLRRAFPLVANKTGETQVEEDDVSIEALEARNVVDGLALVEQVQTSGIRTYPFGVPRLPAVTDPVRVDAINRQVERLLDISDAVSDVAIAESVHQVLQGNYDRAAGTFDAYSKGNFPPIPEVVQTPRSGTTLTHRVSLHFEGGLDPADPSRTSPRAKGEPAIDQWLAGILPEASDIVCQVEFFDRTVNALVTPTISAADLGLMPIDLLYMVTLDRAQAMTALDDAILHRVATVLSPSVDSSVTIHYTQPVADKVTFFELAPLIHSLRALVLRSRPLRPTDTRLHQEARKSEDAASSINLAKITEVSSGLEAARVSWTTFIDHISTTLSGPDEEAIIAGAVADIDLRIREFIDAANALARFGFANTGIGDTLEWRRVQFAAVIVKLEALIDRWHAKHSTFEELLHDYDVLDSQATTTDEMRFAKLATIERVLTTKPAQPPPATPALVRTDLEGALAIAFVNARTQLEAISSSPSSLAGLHTALAALNATIATHDAVPFSVDDERREIRRYARDLMDRGVRTDADIASRLARADQLVAAAGGPAERIDNLTLAARSLLDPDFAILPEFSLAAENANELRNAWDHRLALLHYLENDLHRAFPVDEWLYGVARVREKIKQFEASIMLIEALSPHHLELVPLQFPYRTPDFWLALEYPDKVPATGEPFAIDEDKLLYSASFAVPFDETRPLCGVQVDEWTEVIPVKEETAGLAFHFDRPNTEPPQTLLLATSPDLTGEWQWNDLVDAVRETMALSRKRAVEPAHLDHTAYARFLPAVLSSVTTYPVMQTLNFSFNNDIQFRES